MRPDEAWFVVMILAAAAILALATGEILADALQPVSDAFMASTKEATQAAMR